MNAVTTRRTAASRVANVLLSDSASVSSSVSAVLLASILVSSALPVAHAAAQTAAPSAPRVIAAQDDTLTTAFDVDGVSVILRRVTANNVVAANVYLLGGVQQLTPATQGIELLLLEASEEGTRKYSRDELRSRMARLGSSIGVSPGVDWSTVEPALHRGELRLVVGGDG